jgi:hypothetical protein
MRRIKVEQLGDGFRRENRAGIRLKGKWLRDLGFQPGGHVRVALVGPGVMELRFTPQVCATSS